MSSRKANQGGRDLSLRPNRETEVQSGSSSCALIHKMVVIFNSNILYISKQLKYFQYSYAMYIINISDDRHYN